MWRRSLFVTSLLTYVLEQTDGLTCNFCVHSRRKKDQMDGIKQHPDCMNHLKFMSRVDMRRECATKEQFCKSKVTNLNGFFILIERDCAVTCEEGCEERGYGLFYTECTRCCRDHLCNEYDGREYYRPKASPQNLAIPGLAVFLVLLMIFLN
ncbi:unnamed protein product [Nippostrongylus brasiliensis]|uniref:Toxin_TOLIP domain-containing protein n=1 Tax=Nippostrongylus brasiliensis TaxID=27835 RepID=A0A0N4Y7S9_NIPBR|nr:unnamed protein product [Nippostrongylus brasiliensis]